MTDGANAGEGDPEPEAAHEGELTFVDWSYCLLSLERWAAVLARRRGAERIEPKDGGPADRRQDTQVGQARCGPAGG